jgi:hypothetical protein
MQAIVSSIRSASLRAAISTVTGSRGCVTSSGGCRSSTRLMVWNATSHPGTKATSVTISTAGTTVIAVARSTSQGIDSRMDTPSQASANACESQNFAMTGK